MELYCRDMSLVFKFCSNRNLCGENFSLHIIIWGSPDPAYFPGWIYIGVLCELADRNMFTAIACGGGWTSSLAIFSIILALFCIIFKCNWLWIYYWNCLHMYKALVMFWNVIFSVAHCRVEGKTTSFHWFSYTIMLAYMSLNKINLQDHGCIWVWMC